MGEELLSNVVHLKQPLRKRIKAWLKLSREDRLDWLAIIIFVLALFVDARGQTDKATFMMCILIVLLLLIKR